MKLRSEQDLLDPKIRANVIAEITSSENVNRRNEYLKRYEIYKDLTSKWVIKSLQEEGLKRETIALMSTRASNVSIARKIVNKLARTYVGGVSRETSNGTGTNIQLDELAQLLDFDQKQKKSDRYRELYKNCAIQFVPEQVGDDDNPSFKIKMRILSPWQYDVIEDQHDREIPKCYILSDFTEQNQGMFAATEQQAGIHYGKRALRTTDKMDNIIADDPSDAGLGKKKRTFIWWSDHYHFTTDEKGEIIPELSPEEGLNPIEMLPIVNIAEEQDGQFWAEGGSDITDGSILVNKIITDMFSIAYIQGFGQFVITGKNLKEKIVMGPHHAIQFDYDPEDGDPQPSVSVVSANPPLEMWMRSVEQYVALLLSTNNLSPRMVSTSLDAVNFPSGIAMLIEMSEATDDISDKQESYKDSERLEWEIVKRWQNYLFDRNALADKFAEIGRLPEDLDVMIRFHEQKPVVTEDQKLANIKARRELGINSEVELLMIDNPDLTQQQAEEKLLKIKQERLERFASSLVQPLEEEEEETDAE